MKKIMNKLIALAVLGIFISLVPMSAKAQVVGRDKYLLQRLWPKKMPKMEESHPAKLKFQLTHPILPANVEFKGSLGVNAEITEAEMLQILKNALPAGNYGDLEDVVNDVARVEELFDRISFNDEDADRILDNWKTLFGIGDILALLSGDIPLPSLDAQGIAGMILTAAEGDVPGLPSIVPVLPGIGTVVDGIFITFNEYKLMQQRYANIIEMSQTKERLRAYNDKVNAEIRYKWREKEGRAFIVNAQDIEDFSYQNMPGLKQIWTADLVLRNQHTGMDGTYSGHLKLTMEADMLAFDDGWAKWYADNVLSMPPSYQYYPSRNEGELSEVKVVFEIPLWNVPLKFYSNSGQRLLIMEEYYPGSGLLTQTELIFNVKRTIAGRYDKPNGVGYGESTVELVEKAGVYSRCDTTLDYTIIPNPPYSNANTAGPNCDTDSIPWPYDLLPWTTIGLVVDMQ